MNLFKLFLNIFIFSFLSLLFSCELFEEKNDDDTRQLDICDQLICGTACRSGLTSECNTDSEDCDVTCNNLASVTAFSRGKICPDQDPKSCDLGNLLVGELKIGIVGLDIDIFYAEVVVEGTEEIYATSDPQYGGSVEYDSDNLKANISLGVVNEELYDQNLTLKVNTLLLDAENNEVLHTVEYRFGQGVFKEE